MRVLDASVVTDALAVAGPGGDLARRLLAEERALHTPAMLTVEVTSALRSMERKGDISATVARESVLLASQLRCRRYPFEPFVRRVWELKENITPYDAWYVAVAEALDVVLVTGDGRLRKAPGPRCPVLSPEAAVAGS